MGETIDRPPQSILDRIVTTWQKDLATNRKAQGYVKGRALWHPELLRALHVGYSSGRLAQIVPAQGKVKRQLQAMGLLNERANEFFYNRLVVPLYDEAGVLVNVYGRTLASEHSAPHLYLPGPRRGVFNLTGIREAAAVILTESILDALSLQVLGFHNTTASFGVTGFTADLRAALVKAQTSRVYCVYDADPAGEQGADQLAHDLATHGMEVLRVELPCKDPNDFLKGGGTRADFQKHLDQATVIRVRGGPPPTKASPASSAVSPPPSREPCSPADRAVSPAPRSSPLLIVPLGDRIYQVEEPPVTSAGQLQVVLRVTRQSRTFVDTLNVLSDRARASFVSRAFTAFRGQVPKKILEEDFFALLDEVETRVREGVTAVATAAPMTDVEREEALAFLKRSDLVDQVLKDLCRMGVVGEDDNKLLAYLVATSRKLDKPLSLSVISRSGAGKSWLLNCVVDLMPPEEVLQYTRMSPRALFYDEPGRYKHKILFIEEAIGAKEGDLGVRSMQSERRLANLVTMTDPKTGQLRTQETVVEGPLTYLTSSVDPLDYETATRSFEVTIDESNEQTGRIVAQQFHDQTLAGIREKMASKTVSRCHQNAQRLLEPLWVVNPYASQLTFPSHTLRVRREQPKYVGLMNTLALLFQHQRPIQTFTEDGQTYRYVEVAPDDIGIANRLMALALTRALSDLPGAAQMLLLKIQEFVTKEADARGADPLAITFNRRQVREWLEWADHQMRDELERLVELEFIEVASGSFGKRYVYTLSPDHRLLVQAGMSIDERIEALGLTPVSKLKPPRAP